MDEIHESKEESHSSSSSQKPIFEQQGIWTHRGVDDIIYLWEGDKNWFKKEFPSFLRYAAALQRIPIIAGWKAESRDGKDFYTVDIDWRELVSIEIQVAKTEGAGFVIHPKFCFRSGYAARIVPGYQAASAKKSFANKVQWFKEDNFGNLAAVFKQDSGEGSKDSTIMDDLYSFMTSHEIPVLPDGKNIYIYKREFAQSMALAKEAKK